MKDIEKFKKFLTNRGAVILAETNQWELVRFKTVNGVSVVYTNKKGNITFTGESDKAYKAWKNKHKWKPIDRKRRHLKELKARLANRDGKKCFFCHARLGFDELTIEHILSFSHGGSDNINNLCLACEPCNIAVGNMPVTKKVLYRAQKLASRMFDAVLKDDDGNEYGVIFKNEPIMTNYPQLLQLEAYRAIGAENV